MDQLGWDAKQPSADQQLAWATHFHRTRHSSLEITPPVHGKPWTWQHVKRTRQ